MSKIKHLIHIGSLCVLGIFLYTQGYEAIFGIEKAHAELFSHITDVCANFPSGTMSCAISVANIMTWIVFTMLILLISPDVIFEIGNTSGPPESNLITMLNTIWILSRDLMNIIFAVVLIVVAIYVVITAKKEFVVSFFPKFVLAVVLVNFSWFFSFVILDAANVLATTIYEIPSLVYSGNPLFCEFDPVKGKSAMTGYKAVQNVYFFPSVDDSESPYFGGATKPTWNCDLEPLLCYQQGPLPFDTAAGHSVILNGLIANHGHLQELGLVADAFKGPDAFSDAFVFTIRQALVLIIVISLLFPLLAMAVAFLVRIPVIWLTIAFMPFAFLSFVGGDKIKEWTGTEGPKAIWDTFLKFAFLPAMVAVPLTVGFIMTNVGSSLACGSGGGGAIASKLEKINLDFMPSIGSPYQLLWLIMVEIILWVGVFMVLKGVPIVGRASEAIRQQGAALGKFAGTLPLTMTPLPMAGGMTPWQIGKMMKPTALWNAAQQSKGGMSGFKDALMGTTEERAVNTVKQKLDTMNATERKNKTDAVTTAINGVISNPIRNSLDKLRQTLKDIGVSHADADNPTTMMNLIKNLQSQGTITIDASKMQPLKEKIDNIVASNP